MTKIKEKILKKTSNFHNKIANNYKEKAAIKRLDKLHITGLKVGLAEIGEEDNLDIATEYYYQCRANKSPKEALENAFRQVTEKNDPNGTRYNRALKAAMSVINADKSPNIETPLPLLSNRHLNEWLLAGLIVIVALIVILFFIFNNQTENAITPNGAVTKQQLCSGSWMMEPTDYSKSSDNLFTNGIQAIKDAKTNADAKKALLATIDMYKTHREYLIFAAKTWLPAGSLKTDTTTISPDGSCASESTVQTYLAIVNAINQASVKIGYAPTSWYNTHVNQGKVAMYSNPGITGNTKAILIILSDGRESGVLGRCGNIVTPPIKPIPPHHKNRKLTPKDPSKDVGVNPAVAPYKKDNTGGNATLGHKVSPDNGAVVSNGLQTNPAADAAAADNAAQAIENSNAANSVAAQQQAIQSGGGVVDNNQAHTQLPIYGPGW